MLEDGRVAVDIGLLRFDADLTTALTELAGFRILPAVDLYDQITRGLTGQWKPESDAGLFWRELERILRAPERPVGIPLLGGRGRVHPCGNDTVLPRRWRRRQAESSTA